MSKSHEINCPGPDECTCDSINVLIEQSTRKTAADLVREALAAGLIKGDHPYQSTTSGFHLQA